MDKATRRFLTDEETRRLLTIPKTHTRTGLRNVAMMRLLLEGGLKVSELVGREARERGDGDTSADGLRIGDLDWERGVVIVCRGKVSRHREIAVSRETAGLLREWVYQRPTSDSLLLFTTLRGGKLNNRYIRQFLARYGRQANVEIPVKPSVLRNTFAQRVRQAGGDLATVRRRLGLSDNSVPPGPYGRAGEDGAE